MARRIVFAEMNDIWRENSERAGQSLFKLDDQIEIDWKFRIGRDYDSGELISELPPYSVKFRSQNIGDLTDAEDIAWVRKATDQDPGDGAIGLVNEIVYGEEIIYGERKTIIKGFRIEVLTGVDARKLKASNEFEASKQTFMKYWWLIPLLLALIWWKF
ncbi:hypothetical protein GHL01_00495 [Sinorhizobium meliloti]|uniref:hypothetical protein n=1 Tax=Rhizobium meliloti TaxID=382 RepID=UPI001297CFE7|nr:hypothetical protein [Sinorhizobium meliloti]MQV12224.1 hypothetical protein [Sinorhizobium meliloti]